MNPKFIMNHHGFFVIEVSGKRSFPVDYRGIASVEVDGKTYIGVSQYFDGYVPCETVIEIKTLDNVQNLEEDFEHRTPAKDEDLLPLPTDG